MFFSPSPFWVGVLRCIFRSQFWDRRVGRTKRKERQDRKTTILIQQKRRLLGHITDFRPRVRPFSSQCLGPSSAQVLSLLRNIITVVCSVLVFATRRSHARRICYFYPALFGSAYALIPTYIRGSRGWAKRKVVFLVGKYALIPTYIRGSRG